MANSKQRPIAVPEHLAAKLLRRFLIDPVDQEPVPRLSDLQDDEAIALNSIVSAFGRTLNELAVSIDLQTMVRAHLESVLTSGPLSPDRQRGAMERLGNAGRLPSSAYRLTFKDIVREFRQFGERESHIERAVFNADAVQHLGHRADADLSGLPGEEGVSIFIREVTTKGTRILHLVVVRRNALEFSFAAAWKLLPPVLQSWQPTQKSPLDWLEVFANYYGYPVQVGNGLPSKFIRYAAIPLLNTTRGDIVKNLVPPGRPFNQQALLRVSALNVAEVSLVYCVDSQRYAHDLRQSGQVVS